MRKFRVTVNGNTYEVDVEEVGGSAKAVSTASTPAVPVTEVAQPTAPVSSTGSIKIEAPMQGKIVDIRVSEGEMVKAGDVVAILEAMKMENEVVAPEAGTIASINAATGQSVNAGDVIITLN